MEAKADETPLVSFILLAYNQERFVREAVAGALAQTYSPLEIILSDDCSTDETFRLMCQAAEEYDGPHRLILNRNKVNIGIAEHLNLLTKTASGSIFVVAAADDVSLPHRTEALIGQFKNNPSVTAAFSGAIDVDEKGREIAKSAVNEPSTERFRPHSIINSLFGGFGATYAWRREVFERFGPISARLRSEDVVIPFRCALLGEINYTDIPLVHYRRHQTNTWKHTHEFASWRDYYGWHKARAQDVIEVLSQMSADLAAFAARNGIDFSASEEFSSAASAVRIKREEYETELHLCCFAQASKRDAMRYILRRRAALGLGVRFMMRAFLQAMLPQVYFQVRRIRQRRAI